MAERSFCFDPMLMGLELRVLLTVEEAESLTEDDERGLEDLGATPAMILRLRYLAAICRRPIAINCTTGSVEFMD